jgi:hypothetical protein
MLSWLRSLFTPPRPAGPAVVLRRFGSADRPISRDGVTPEADGLKIESAGRRTVRLFEIPEPQVEQCMLTYRASMKLAGVEGGVYLEMWCAFAGNEYFSRGLHHKATGTSDWASYETPFYLKVGQSPSLIKLNVVFEGPGTVWIREVELGRTPLA